MPCIIHVSSPQDFSLSPEETPGLEGAKDKKPSQELQSQIIEVKVQGCPKVWEEGCQSAWDHRGTVVKKVSPKGKLHLQFSIVDAHLTLDVISNGLLFLSSTAWLICPEFHGTLSDVHNMPGEYREVPNHCTSSQLFQGQPQNI